MIRIAIIDDDRFVHHAINTALEKYKKTEIEISNFHSLKELTQSILSDNYDTVIFEPNGKDYTLMQSLDFIVEWLSYHRNKANLILMTNLALPLSITLFGNLGVVSDIIYKSESVDRVLNKLLYNEQYSIKTGRYFPGMSLTTTEYRVLNDIFLGYSHYEIAKKSKRSIKTISQHKMNALGKLGVKSLQELISSLSGHHKYY